MSKYYGVTKVKEVGKEISYHEAKSNVEEKNMSKNTSIIAIACNGLYCVAPDVTKPDNFKDFREAYDKGYYLDINYYEVNTDKLGDCPNEGRVYES